MFMFGATEWPRVMLVYYSCKIKLDIMAHTLSTRDRLLSVIDDIEIISK